MDHLIKELYQSNTPKIIEWYVGRDKKMENNFKICLILGETNYLQQIL